MGENSIRAYNLDCESRKVQSRRSRDLKTRPPCLKPELFHLTTMHQRYLLAVHMRYFKPLPSRQNGGVEQKDRWFHYNYIIEIQVH